jgi:hypothetical protein
MTSTTASPLDRHASPVGEGRRTGRAVAALVVGIIAVIAFLIPIFGIILGIIALSLGLTARATCRRASRSTPWQATAGWILGAVAVVASIANIIAGVAMRH